MTENGKKFILDMRLNSRVIKTEFLYFQAKNGSGATETKQWQDMIAKPRQSVVVWHRLKPGE